MSNENSRVDFESGVVPYAMQALTDSGDAKKFSTQAFVFSEDTGSTPIVRPNGVLTGGTASPSAVVADNTIDIAAMSCNLAGVEKAVVAAASTTVSRASTDVASITSVIVNSSGVYALIKGVDSADATFSEVRGEAGAPPYIPADSIEDAQIRTTTNTAGPITQEEIFQVVGTHMEKADFPVYNVDNSAAEINFDVPLPLVHTGDVPKAVFASYSQPVFTEQQFANDFVPADTSFSVSSAQVYGATVGASSSSLGQASFTAILKDGITDPIVKLAGKNLWIRYYQDKFKSAHILTQGKLGLGRTFAASDNPKVTVTISPTVESTNRVS